MKKMVFLLSGSIFASKIPFGDGDFPFHVDVIGRDGESKGAVTYHGRVMDNIQFLKEADALVVNGGFSAVSEAMMLGKPTFVIPVPGHAEQFVNARVLCNMGYGYSVREDEVLDKIRELQRCDRWENLSGHPSAPDFNGARDAAAIIIGVMARRNSVGPGRLS